MAQPPTDEAIQNLRSSRAKSQRLSLEASRLISRMLAQTEGRTMTNEEQAQMSAAMVQLSEKSAILMREIRRHSHTAFGSVLSEPRGSNPELDVIRDTVVSMDGDYDKMLEALEVARHNDKVFKSIMDDEKVEDKKKALNEMAIEQLDSGLLRYTGGQEDGMERNTRS